jgi:transposase
MFADAPTALELLDRYLDPAVGERAWREAPGRSWRGTRAAVVAPSPSCSSVAAPRSAAGEGECVRALVAVLRPLVAQIATLGAAVEHAVDAHPDGKIVTSLFRKGRVCACSPRSATTVRGSCRVITSLPRAAPRL